jgi:hypothetical protein
MKSFPCFIRVPSVAIAFLWRSNLFDKLLLAQL